MQDDTEQFDEILNQSSTGMQLNDFLKELQKQGVGKMFEGMTCNKKSHNFKK